MMRYLAPMLLMGCDLFAPELPPVTTDLLVLEAENVERAAIDAALPTDLTELPGGRVAVLDPSNQRILVLDDSLRVDTTYPGPSWGLPLRGSLADSGDAWWSLAPDEFLIHRLNAEGKPTLSLRTVHEGRRYAPVGLVDQGDEVVVATREGALLWLDAAKGDVHRIVRDDADGFPMGGHADIAEAPGGDLWVVDTLSARVHRFSPQGEPRTWFGHYGYWLSYLAKPKAIALGPQNTVLIADSAQGTVQVFDEDGTGLGGVAQGGELLRLDHPLALASDDEGQVWVLDTTTSTVVRFQLTDAQIDAARERAQVRHLRQGITPAGSPAKRPDALCFQCHDGVVNDDRFVWRSDLYHHPVGVTPETAPPEGLPLDSDGQLACTTCHSPHGTLTLGELKEGNVEERIRHHAPAGEQFTRLLRSDASLCLACHEGTAHQGALAQLDFGDQGHLVGEALSKALAQREGAEADPTQGACLTCHAVHGAPSESLMRSPDDGTLCLSCHPDKADPEQNHRRDDEVFAAAAAADIPFGGPSGDCALCHDVEGGTRPGLLADAGERCATCHTDVHLRGDHASIGEGVPCLSCHDVHGNDAAHLLHLDGTPTTADPNACSTCHKPRKGFHPETQGHGIGSVGLTCADCHDAHRPVPTPTCGTCHEEQHTLAAAGGHGGQTCTDCHSPHHDVKRPAPEGAQAASVPCLGCHGPKGTVASARLAFYEHPEAVFTPNGERWKPLAGLRLYDDQGRVQPEGELGDLSCGSCHQTHGPDAKKADHLRISGVSTSCAACHGANGLPYYRWFHSPERREGLQ